MGYSGKPSKGCAPCRDKRTKCDLAVPSCTQCIRKGRVCHGYRNEQDIMFRPQNDIVERRLRKRNQRQLPSASVTHISMPLWNPSRLAAVETEATMHFFGHLNEKLFASHDYSKGGGFDYIMPVYSQDVLRNGPVPEIIRAIGMAALGSNNKNEKLLYNADKMQNQAIRHLYQQMQDQRMALSDSTILTCLLLSLYENVIGSPSAEAMTYHLKGAVELARGRGLAQFNTEIGRGIYSRMRGFVLAHCLQTREPVPEVILTFLDDETVCQKDIAPDFYKLLARLCQVQADHKSQGFVTQPMAEEADLLIREFEAWQPCIPDWHPFQRPSAENFKRNIDDEMFRFMWLSNTWFFKHAAQVLALDILIDWAGTQLMLTPGSPASRYLDASIDKQKKLCGELRASTEYYFCKFKEAESCQRTSAGYGLLWPLYVLSCASTSTTETMGWIASMASNIAEAFRIPQGQKMAEVMTNVMTMYCESVVGPLM